MGLIMRSEDMDLGVKFYKPASIDYINDV